MNMKRMISNFRIFSITKKDKMEKIYIIKYKKFKILKRHIFFINFVIPVICGKWGSKCKRIFEEEKSIAILKIIRLIKICNYF